MKLPVQGSGRVGQVMGSGRLWKALLSCRRLGIESDVLSRPMIGTETGWVGRWGGGHGNDAEREWRSGLGS